MDEHNTSYRTINHPPTKEAEQLPPSPVNLLDLPFIRNCIQLKERRGERFLGKVSGVFHLGFLEPSDEQIASLMAAGSGAYVEFVQ